MNIIKWEYSSLSGIVEYFYPLELHAKMSLISQRRRCSRISTPALFGGVDEAVKRYKTPNLSSHLGIILRKGNERKADRIF